MPTSTEIRSPSSTRCSPGMPWTTIAFGEMHVAAAERRRPPLAVAAGPPLVPAPLRGPPKATPAGIPHRKAAPERPAVVPNHPVGPPRLHRRAGKAVEDDPRLGVGLCEPRPNELDHQVV